MRYAQQLIKTEPFAIGFNEFKNNIPLDGDKYHLEHNQRYYEQGRQFACCSDNLNNAKMLGELLWKGDIR